jgi:hypothetical protein
VIHIAFIVRDASGLYMSYTCLEDPQRVCEAMNHLHLLAERFLDPGGLGCLL